MAAVLIAKISLPLNPNCYSFLASCEVARWPHYPEGIRSKLVVADFFSK